jgi:hypothetical protein
VVKTATILHLHNLSYEIASRVNVVVNVVADDRLVLTFILSLTMEYVLVAPI